MRGFHFEETDMLKRIGRAVALCALFLAFGAQAEEAPDALVKRVSDEVLTTIKQTKDQKKLMQAAEQKVLPYFDFKQMTQLAVGRSWSQANPAQQEALERGFRTLLVRTYTAALARTSGEGKVDVKPGKAEGDETVVRTVASEPGSKPVQIDYRMAKASGSWKVYDVVVENLSLVTSYRSSFQSEIARAGIDGLIKSIEAKNQKTAEG
jgi:phospholipid transport system substrate-binding protein